MSIRLAIVGYGNLGRGVELAASRQGDMTLTGVYTRREPTFATVTGVPVRPYSDLLSKDVEADVLVLCGGSRSDLPVQTPELAARYNVVDSFDTHARIPEHFARVDSAATDTVAVISAGWDPGLFSLNRALGGAILPAGQTSTFWGRGVSQGHSDAVRRVPGVADAVQYTIPSEVAMDAARAGTAASVPGHVRHCVVVAEEGADREEIRRAIVTMPDYFAPYETTVEFVSAEELARDHSTMPHGGFVIHSGETGNGNRQVMEFSLALESNPEFTASVLVAYARAAVRLHAGGARGAHTPFDIAPGLLSPLSAEELRATLL